MGRIEDRTVEMHQAWPLTATCCAPSSLTLCLRSTRWRHGALNLATAAAARSSKLGESDIIFEFLETARRDRTLGTPFTPVMVAVVATGKVEAAATEKADGWGSTDEAAEAPTRTVVTRPRLPVAMIPTSNHRRWCPSERVLQVWQGRPDIRANRTEKLCSRCNGRGYTTDICPTSDVGGRGCAGDDGRGWSAGRPR